MAAQRSSHSCRAGTALHCSSGCAADLRQDATANICARPSLPIALHAAAEHPGGAAQPGVCRGAVAGDLHRGAPLCSGSCCAAGCHQSRCRRLLQQRGSQSRCWSSRWRLFRQAPLSPCRGTLRSHLRPLTPRPVRPAGGAAGAPVLWPVWAHHQDLGEPAAAARPRPRARARAAGPPDRLRLRHIQAA